MQILTEFFFLHLSIGYSRSTLVSERHTHTKTNALHSCRQSRP
uniref:Uncharacterized protein n=1 Tax=Arundo donax TaxID=35708 RepID=A0A0A8YFQ3_ARUDO